MKTFATSQYRDSVLNVRRFMFDDIDKTIGLADNPNVGAPNFLLAVHFVCLFPHIHLVQAFVLKPRKTYFANRLPI